MADEIVEKAGGYVSKLVFNDGESVGIRKNDIVLFVGPNNAGKSQSLKDIYDLSRTKCPTIVVSDIEIQKYSGSLIQTLNHISIGRNDGRYTHYQFLGGTVIVNDHTEHTLLSKPFFEEYRHIFVANLNTSARLSICLPPTRRLVASAEDLQSTSTSTHSW